MDLVMCVHARDVDGLFSLALRSYLANFGPRGDLVLVTNDVGRLRARLAEWVPDLPAVTMGDGDLLSRAELRLDGWYRQQVVKLRAHELTGSRFICSLGADTILLHRVRRRHLVENGSAILYYNRYPDTDSHLRYERDRLISLARLIDIDPVRSFHYGDFINDLFCFDTTYLRELDSWLRRKFGSSSVWSRFSGVRATAARRCEFGEWTLYSMFVLDVLQESVPVRNSRSRHIRQVHNRRVLERCDFDARALHVVPKDIAPAEVEQRMAEHGVVVPALPAVAVR